MKQILIILAFLLTVLSGFGQSTKKGTEPTVAGIPYRAYFEDYIRNSFNDSLQGLGIDGISYLRFALSENGNIKDVKTDSSTMKLQRLNTFLITMLQTTNGKWKVDKHSDSNTESIFILPVVYTLQHKGNTIPIQKRDPTELLAELFSFLRLRLPDYVSVTLLLPVHYISPFK
jgi:hypothetical protein